MPTVRVVATDHLRTSNGTTAPPFFSPVEALRLSRRMMRERVQVCPHHMNPPDDGLGGMCAHIVACNYGYLTCGFDDAISMWRGIPDKYRRHGIAKMRTAPAGALLFWEGGSDLHGHVAISDGTGNVLSTDLPDPGFMGRVRVDDVFPAQEPKGWTFPFFELAPIDHARSELRDLDMVAGLQRDTIACAKKAIRAVNSTADKDKLRAVVRDCRRGIQVAEKVMLSVPV